MNIEMYSYSHSNLPKEILEHQYLVFNKFGYKINQIVNDKSHGENLQDIILNCKCDCLVIFDVDCIPLNENLFKYIKNDLNEYDLIGCIGCANHIDKNNIYVHPSFMFFNPMLYFLCGCPSLLEDNNNDVAQLFTKECLKNNKKVKYWMNSYSNDYIWDLPNDTKFGHGTVYEEKIYHQFEIRKFPQRENFINKCKQVLNN